MSQPHWNFPPQIEGYMRQDPVNSQFFTTNVVGGLAHALVRETIQNVLDAKLSTSQPAEVMFRFLHLKRAQVQKYFETLLPHLQSENNGIHEHLKNLKKEIRFLIVEDFGTTGLLGDTLASSDDNNNNNGFYYFWRNIGRSGKSTDSRGRWGLGKSVFPATSQINTFWGITKRHSEPDKIYLMGNSVLKIHKVNSQEHTAYGHYGHFSTTKPNFVVPITDDEEVNRFCDLFKLRRKETSGLSLIIAIPDEEITEDRLTQSVIQQYFYPILEDSLKVRVGNVKIERSTLEEEILRLENNANFNKDVFLKALDFVLWSMRLPHDDHKIFPLPADLTKAPRWAEYFSSVENVIDNWKQEFSQNRRIGFIITTKVQLKHESPEQANFKVYLELDDTLSRAENYFIREGITITGIRTLTQREMRGMVVIDETPLTTMLGDAENPAHTEWQKDSQNFKGKYIHASSTLNFVKNSIRDLARKLTEASKELDEDLLKDMFFLEKDIEDEPTSPIKKRKKSKKKAKKTDKPTIPPLPRSPTPIIINRSESGVTIRRNTESNKKVTQLKISFAYDVRTGNPFKKYTPFDFELEKSPIVYDIIDGKIENVDSNKMIVSILSENFVIRVNGFHKARDLMVNVRSETTE